ncbi:MAG: radical SAM protein [Magnetococcales bacterium]|nr:radical SAM protein [Magnetococcales bacterium]
MNDPFRIDSHKLIYHPRRVAELIECGGDWDKAKGIYPLYVEISPLGACNHRCSFCAVDFVGYKSTRLDAALLGERLREMGRLGVKSIMLAGEGEPLLHKELPRMVVDAGEAGLDVAITSNATVLPPRFLEDALPRLSWFKASINAGTPVSYAAIHRTRERDFHKAVDNLRRMVETRRRDKLSCTLGAQALLLPDNAGEMATLARLCRDDIGLDYLVVKPYSQHQLSHTRTFAELDYAPYAELGKELAACATADFRVIFRSQTMARYESNERYTTCRAVPFLWAYIMADGTVSGCSAYLLDPRFEYGNINTATFQEIWEGERRRQAVPFVAHELDIGGCRRSCRMDAINGYLHQLTEEPVPHVNFI